MKTQNTLARRLLVLASLLLVCIVLFAACNAGGNIPTDTSKPTEETKPTDKGTDEGNDQTEPHIHAFGEWTTTKKANCTEDGVNERYCACGEKQTQSVSALGHTNVIDDAVAATCTTEGKTEGKHCTVCNEVIVAQTTIGKLGHVEVIDAAVAATCTTDGKTEGKHCSVCGETLIAQNNIPASHTDGEWVVDTNPTCTEDGSKHQECSVCSTSIKTEKISATGHTDGKWITDTNATCTEDGSKHQVCSVCNATIKTEAIAATGHTDGEWVTDTNATCTEDGSKHQVCSVCNATIKTEAIAATGHTDGEWITDTNATCTVDGSKHQVCSVCNATIKTEAIAAKGHSYSITIVKRDCGNNGKKVYTCGICEHSYDEEISSIVLSFMHTSTSSSTINGYGSYSKGYEVTVTGGYGTILLKYELYTSATATNPTSTIDFTTDTDISVSFRGYANAIDNYVYQITAKDEAGNISIYRFSLKDESLISYEHKGEVEHTFSDWSVTKESTCSEYGEKQSVCSVCNNTITDIVEKKPHTVAIDKAVAPTCIETGLTEGKHCSVCNTVLIAQEVVSSHGHNFEWQTIKEATKAEDGFVQEICSKCDTVNSTKTLYATGSIGLEYTKSSFQNYWTVTGIGECTDTDIVIPQYYENLPVLIIGDSAFRDCTTIKNVVILNGITTINKYTFAGCTSLTSITIPGSVTSIGSHTFDGCSGLTSITIPDSVTSIGKGAFSGCSSLTSINIPDGVTSIGSWAFDGCSSLTSINIPDGVTSIGEYAFYGCSSLTNINIPDGVTSIGYFAFYGCIDLNAVYITDIVAWCDVSFENGANPLSYAHNLYLNGELVTEVVIPDGVTSICERAFSGCKSLTSINLPDSVISIGQLAFHACSSLTSVTIGNSVTSIGDYAFYNCSNLASITIPDSVNSIGIQMFYNCDSLTSITIPHGVTKIGNSAFYFCDNLTSITFEGTVTEWNNITFGKNWNDGVPATEVVCSDGVVKLS